MKKFLYILVTFIFPAIAVAQVPGYQGKRFSVDGDFFFMSALFNPNQNAKTVPVDDHNIINGSSYYYNNYGNNGPLGDINQVHPESFNTRYNLNVSYVLSRIISIELSGGMFATGWNRRFTETKTVQDPYGSTTSGRFEYSDLYKVQGKMVGVNFKFFKKSKGAIAPNGAYFKLGTSFIMNTPTYLGAYENTGNGVSKDRAQASNMILFTCGTGKQMIFYDRLILRYGIDLGMSPTVLNKIGDGFLTFIDAPNNKDELGNTLNERVLLQNLVNINLGVGFIIF